jgi:AraC family transcriptional regulator, regulatory protein of adaptative response / methylated-DNA-[protein]-cysteine methyltransferase
MLDYQRIATAIDYLVANSQRQPTVEEVAAHVGLSASHFQRLFRRWSGLPPKRFLQVLTMEQARARLSQSQSVLAVTDAVGLSSASRLYDHCVQLEAMTPGEIGRGGAGLAIDYGVHDSPYGPLLVAMTKRGICRLEFVEAEADPVAWLAALWPAATLNHNPSRTRAPIAQVFSRGSCSEPLSLHVAGTNFQVSVWRALLQVSAGQLTSYGRRAVSIGRPRAARAIGQAVGSNPVALVIPCHRVIRESGALGGYRWGESRKRAMLWHEQMLAMPADESQE